MKKMLPCHNIIHLGCEIHDHYHNNDHASPTASASSCKCVLLCVQVVLLCTVLTEGTDSSFD